MIDLDMGAYAGFVWPAWGISAIVLAALAARAVIAARRWNAALKQLDQDLGTPRARAAQSPAAQPE
ncbi:heme exporter protein CcmD [Brevundimonas sp. TWP2-3-4b2]|uniref:heme exporter protein CcmD n=1 Tax=Brevundimonas sp. TWP2-3-4b2 TaxID=2804595 RepID=UPI003CF94584